MLSVNFVVLTIFGCGLVMWLTKIIPFILLKYLKLNKGVIEYLSFVPVVIMSALWFENLFDQHLGHLPTLNVENCLVTLPTLLTAIITKSLVWVVMVGIVSMAFIRMFI